MLDTFWNNQEFIFAQRYHLIPKFHVEFALDHKKHFVFMVVFVPYELAPELDELDMLAVELARNPRIPMVAELGQFFG
jgi:hypothetical protein